MTTTIHEPRETKEASRQLRVYAFIRDYILSHQYPPSFQEIADGAGLSSRSHVLHHLLGLHKKGLITFTPGLNRGIRLRDMEVANISYGNRERLKVTVVRDGVLFEGFVYRSMEQKKGQENAL